jgi:hypothetical protein
MAALALGGCTPEQDITQCKLEAFRVFPNDPLKCDIRTCSENAASEYVYLHGAKGYEFRHGSCRALRHEGVLATEPDCYKRTDWLAGILGRKRR